MYIDQVCNASLEFEPKRKLIGERPLHIHSAVITSGSSIGIRVKISMVITRRQSVKATNSSISSNQTQYFQETTHDVKRYAVYMNLDRGLEGQLKSTQSVILGTMNSRSYLNVPHFLHCKVQQLIRIFKACTMYNLSI